ncbi:MAG: hypothetical protein HYT61_00540 [Candidatus Yanofskybacteria bacterium]|nr:hypothetical protein [Candidatus Yanofskybacteria bacterium]
MSFITLFETQEQLEKSLESIDYSSVNFFVKDGKRFIEASFLAKEFGYEPGHVARLARQNKIDSFYDQPSRRWYVTKESLAKYQEQAHLNKKLAGLKSANLVKPIIQQTTIAPQEKAISVETDLEAGQLRLAETGRTVLSEESADISIDNDAVSSPVLSESVLSNFHTHSQYSASSRLKAAVTAMFATAAFIFLLIFGMTVLPKDLSLVKDLTSKLSAVPTFFLENHGTVSRPAFLPVKPTGQYLNLAVVFYQDFIEEPIEKFFDFYENGPVLSPLVAPKDFYLTVVPQPKPKINFSFLYNFKNLFFAPVEKLADSSVGFTEQILIIWGKMSQIEILPAETKSVPLFSQVKITSPNFASIADSIADQSFIKNFKQVLNNEKLALPSLNLISTQGLAGGLNKGFADLSQAADTFSFLPKLPDRVTGFFSDLKEIILSPLKDIANYGDNLTEQSPTFPDQISQPESSPAGVKPPTTFSPAKSSGPVYVATPIDQSFIKKLVKQFFDEEKSALTPLNLISVQGSVDDLNQKLADLVSRVNQIPPPLQYIGGGGGGSTTTVGGGDAQVAGSKLTVGVTVVNSGSIGTTSGNFSIDSGGGTTTISDNLTVTGLLSASTASSHSFIGDLSISDDIELTGDASASAFFGAGLNAMTGTTGCSGASADKLLYNATTGKFSCGSDQNSGGGGGAPLGIEIVNSGAAFGTHYGSISFDASHFTVSLADLSASSSYVRLDWGAGGPASLSQDETVAGKWLFNSASTQFNNLLELNGTASVSVANTNFNINLNGTGDFVIQDAGSTVFTVTDTDTITLNNGSADLVSITGNASISSNLELTGTGFASASYFYAQPGTAALPAFAFGNDTDTGIFRSAANQLGLATNGVERLTIDPSGYVGIGTTSPTTKFEVQGTASASNFLTVGAIQVAGGVSKTFSRFGLDDTGHNLIAASDLLVSGMLEINSNTFFDASASVAVNFDVGSGANVIKIRPNAGNNSGFRLEGNARNIKRFTMWPEFAGAVMTGNTTNSVGTMTSDNESSSSFRSYYQWTATSATTQEYKIFVKVPVPNDFSAFNTGVKVGAYKSNANERILFSIRDTANAISNIASVSVATSAENWTLTTSSTPTGTYASGSDMIFIFEMLSSSSQRVRLGSISFDYYSKF